MREGRATSKAETAAIASLKHFLLTIFMETRHALPHLCIITIMAYKYEAM